ncbi:serine/arginine repetitive matrix protein 1-like, partial [Lontra canadensis]|uniref:serine/arginine repetitive matrix protein 1-like n=1 Tax=Lontra canadensis TaxID=76717 RepID=UPI0013F3281C
CHEAPPRAGPLSARQPPPTGSVRELSHQDPADRLRRREVGRPENEGRQRRGAAGGSPALELQDAGLASLPARGTIAGRGEPPPTAFPLAPRRPTDQKEKRKRLREPSPPPSSRRRLQERRRPAITARISQAPQDAAPGPARVPAAARSPPAPASGPASPPRRPSAHLGLDDAREEAQGDLQLHCGRPPARRRPAGPPAHADLSPQRDQLGPRGRGTVGGPGDDPSCEGGGRAGRPHFISQAAPPPASPTPRPRPRRAPGLVAVVVPARPPAHLLRGTGPAAGVTRALRRRRPLRLPHGGQWDRTTRASKTRGAAGGTPPPSAGRGADPSSVVPPGIPDG